MDPLVIVAILWVIPIFVAYSIGRPKGRMGIAYGLLLGWVGVIILALLPPVRNAAAGYRPCPFCKEQIRRDATVCPFCQRDVEAVPAVVSW